jgi:hypothetical protein
VARFVGIFINCIRQWGSGGTVVQAHTAFKPGSKRL